MIPVQFRLYNAAGNEITNMTATLSLQKYSGGIAVGGPIIPISARNYNSGNAFRFAPSGRVYVYRVDSRELSAGDWQLRISLSDGSIYTTFLGLK